MNHLPCRGVSACHLLLPPATTLLYGQGHVHGGTGQTVTSLRPDKFKMRGWHQGDLGELRHTIGPTGAISAAADDIAADPIRFACGSQIKD